MFPRRLCPQYVLVPLSGEDTRLRAEGNARVYSLPTLSETLFSPLPLSPLPSPLPSPSRRQYYHPWVPQTMTSLSHTCFLSPLLALEGKDGEDAKNVC